MQMDQSFVQWLLVAVFAVYVGYQLYRRVIAGDGDDASASVTSETSTGSASFLVSGSYLVGAVGLLVVGATWPLAVERPIVGAFIGALFLAYYLAERREVTQ